MKQLIPFIRKEFYHIFRDRETLIIMFVMPILLVILFGFAIRTEIKDSHITILDKSKDELSIALINKLLSTDYFICDSYSRTDADINQIFLEGEATLALIIPENFSQNFYKNGVADIQLITDASNLNTSTVLKNYTQSIIENFRQERLNIDSEQALFNTSIRMVYNPEMKDVYMFVPGVLALILMVITALMSAISLTREKELGTLDLLTVSPLRTIHVIIGKVIPYLLIAVINTIIIILLSVLIFDMPIHGSLWTLSFVCVLFLLTAVSSGIVISAISQTQQVAIFISIITLFLPTMILSGFIYPIENMPLPLQVLCNIFPSKWFIEAIKAVMLKGSSITTILPQIAVLLVTSIIMLRISVVKYSKKKH